MIIQRDRLCHQLLRSARYEPSTLQAHSVSDIGNGDGCKMNLRSIPTRSDFYSNAANLPLAYRTVLKHV